MKIEWHFEPNIRIVKLNNENLNWIEKIIWNWLIILVGGFEMALNKLSSINEIEYVEMHDYIDFTQM